VAKKLLIIGNDARVRNELAATLACPEIQAWVMPGHRGAALPAYLPQADLIILDVPPSETDEWGLLRQIRELSTAPVIALITVNDYTVRIEGLDRGADYVMTKPVDTRELQARVGALFRRTWTQVPFKPAWSVNSNTARAHR